MLGASAEPAEGWMTPLRLLVPSLTDPTTPCPAGHPTSPAGLLPGRWWRVRFWGRATTARQVLLIRLVLIFLCSLYYLFNCALK